MQVMKAAVLVLALVAVLPAQFAEGAPPARCKTYFQLLELQSPNGPQHTPFNDVFDADMREVDGKPLPNKVLFFHNKIYRGCGADLKTPPIRPGGKAGIHQGHCVETFAPLKFIECYFTWVLRGGTISIQGPMDLTALTGIFTITGGTGKYFAAKGEVSMVFGAKFPTPCNVPADLKPTVNTYTFCMDQPDMTVPVSPA